MASCWVPLSLLILSPKGKSGVFGVSPVRQVEAGAIRLGLVHMGQSVSLAGGGIAAAGEFVAVLHGFV